MHFEFLPRCPRHGNGYPENDVQDDEHDEHRTEKGRSVARGKDDQQHRQEECEPYPYGVGTEIGSQSGAYAAEYRPVGIPVEPFRNLLHGRFFFRIQIVRKTELRHHRFRECAAHHVVALLFVQYEFCDTRFDVGHDFAAVGFLRIPCFELVEVILHHLVGLGVERERDARYAHFHNLFHLCGNLDGLPLAAADLCYLCYQFIPRDIELR